MTTTANLKANCRKVICIGRNYVDHIRELHNEQPKQPFFFLKPPSSILAPGEGHIERPNGVQLHYEVELGLVIGRTFRELDPENEQMVLDSIAGYLLTIDMTARNIQNEAKKHGLPWTTAKGFDTFLPISHFIPKSMIPDPHNVRLYLHVNGDARQNDNTNLMIFRIPRQLSDIARVMTLEPGDIILTGTPKGVGEVIDGDRIQAGIIVNGEVLETSKIDTMVRQKVDPYVFA